jgi:hypothetical protein
MAIREPRCHTYKIACINHALAPPHEMPWHSTAQCTMSITRLGYISQSLVALRSCIEMGVCNGGTFNLSPEVRRSEQPFVI